MTSRDARLVGLFTLVALALRLGFVLAVRRHSFVLNDSLF
jgi:hypothetical protein